MWKWLTWLRPIVACRDCKRCSGCGTYAECQASPREGIFDSFTGTRNGRKFKLCWFVNTDGHCRKFKANTIAS